VPQDPAQPHRPRALGPEHRPRALDGAGGDQVVGREEDVLAVAEQLVERLPRHARVRDHRADRHVRVAVGAGYADGRLQQSGALRADDVIAWEPVTAARERAGNSLTIVRDDLTRRHVRLHANTLVTIPTRS